MLEIDKNKFGDRIETAGAYAVGLGVVGSCVSGILFLGSEPKIDEETVRRLSENVNIFFQTGIASILLAGGGALATKLGEAIKPKS